MWTCEFAVPGSGASVGINQGMLNEVDRRSLLVVGLLINVRQMLKVIGVVETGATR
jgi:hypothetical protein